MEDQAQNNLLKNGNATTTVVKLERRPQREDQEQEEFTPPDGGSRAWLVMVGSFFCNGIIFGVINSYGVIFKELYEDLKMKNVSDASSKAGECGMGWKHVLEGRVMIVVVVIRLSVRFRD